MGPGEFILQARLFCLDVEVEKTDGRVSSVTGKKRTRDETSLSDERSLTQMAYRKIEERMVNYEIIPGQRLAFVDKEAYQTAEKSIFSTFG
jgi:hypothetical protein